MLCALLGLSDSRPVDTFGRQTHEDGLVSVMIDSVTVPGLAAVFDPEAPWIVLSGMGPGVGPDWALMKIPLLGTQLMNPVPATVRMVNYELLISPQEFLDLAPSLCERGLWARQFTKRPENVWFGTDDTPPPADRLRAFGFTVGVHLLHPRESAQIKAASDDGLEAALSRLGLA